jgi:phage terminase large subunit-like protein
MPSRETFAYRRKAQLNAARAVEVTEKEDNSIYAKAANDFPTFCVLMDKAPAPHMMEWHRHLITGESNRYLLDIAGANLDILSPRGSAKSTVLNLFTAWAIGRHTSAQMPLQIIYCSYNIATAIPKSRIIKQLIDNTMFKRIFPRVRLKPGMQSDIGWAVDFEYAGIPRVGDEEYTLRAAGLRGSITSKRAHLCLTGETLVLTDQGEQPIEKIYANPERFLIAVRNSKTHQIDWSNVEAVTRRCSSEIVHIKTTNNGYISATPEHPFLTTDQKYEWAGDISIGQTLIGVTLDKKLNKNNFNSKEFYECQIQYKGKKVLCKKRNKSDSSECSPPDHRQSWETLTVSGVERISNGTHIVYDLELDHTDHNFIANGFVVSNCLVDDPIKSSAELRNPTIREEMNNNWSSVIAPIIFDGGRAICLGTRFHPLDIHKTMFSPSKGWNQVSQEALTYNNKGEPVSYWPEQWSVDYLLQTKELDPVAFAFQYQQQPVLTSDLIVSPDLLVRADVEMEFDSLAVGIDLSASAKETSDYTAFVLGGRLKDKYYIIDAHQCRSVGNLEKIDLLCEMLLEWGILTFENDTYFPTYSTITLVVESVAYQASLSADLKRVLLNDRGLSNIHIHEVSGFRGDKVARFRGTLGLLENKKITFNRYRKFDALFEQIINVGSTSHDDLLDAYTHLITFLQRRGSFSIEY